MAKINSTQAYQLAVAMAPSFLSQLPTNSPQSQALQMQLQTAQGGIQAELYKKAAKDAEKGNDIIGSILSVGSMIPGPQQPFVAAANMGYGAFSGQGGGQMPMPNFSGSTGMPATQPTGPGYDYGYGQYNPQGPPSPYGYGEGNPQGPAGWLAPSSATADGGPAMAPEAATLEGAPPMGEAQSQGGGRNGINPAAALALGGAAVVAKGAANRGEDMMAQEAALNTALKNVADPRQRQRLVDATMMGRRELEALPNDAIRLSTLSAMVESGIPLTKEQARTLNPQVRRSMQSTYGPSLVPMTSVDKMHALVQSYNQSAGGGRITSPYDGLEVYIP